MKSQTSILIFPIFSRVNNFSLPKRRTLYLILLSLSVSILCLLGFYLFQIEKLTKESYLVKTYNQKIDILSKENLALEKKYFQLFSLENVEEKIKNLNFVEVSEIKYIPISSDYLVRKTSQ